ncbi:MAG: penicillin acylase family protein [Alphaproteobacteria bacterium]
MSFPRRLARWLIGLLASLVSLAAFGGLALWFFLQSSLPQTEGRLAAPGLRDAVAIDRDADGVPRIRARSEGDAYFALGYVHAQDRLWQMEAMRRLSAGRLSEALGRQTLAIDRSMRALGLYRIAERIYPGLDPEVRAGLDAYARGVNAYLGQHKGAWPAEYYVVGLRPEPWKPADSLVWGQLMALRLSGDWRSELTRQRLAARLSPEQLEQLIDKPSQGSLVTIEEPARRAAAPPPHDRADYRPAFDISERLLAETMRLLPDASVMGPGTASNSWALAGARTASGKPLLANDPHLGLELPSTWYLARLDAPGFSIAGATAPGVPFHVLGHNGRIAWGFTTTGSDVQDLFIERTDPANGMRYLTPEGSQRFVTRTETIKVRGADDVILALRETRHGPVVSDLASETVQDLPAGDVLAFAAAGLRDDDRSAQALYRLNRARDWDSFRRAVSDFHSPQQNIAYADIDGNIGLYVAGRVPLRKRGEGLFPVPGWTGDYDWTGFVPFDELPHSYNPASGRIANANNRVVGPDYPYPLGRDWTEGFRIQRIEDVLAATARHDMDGMAALQGDVRSLVPQALLPLMLPALRAMPLGEGRYAGLIDSLGAWDGEMARDRAEPLVFNTWLRELTRLIVADELGPLFASAWRPQPAFVANVLREDRRWCDDIATAETETCEILIQRAFVAAMDKLAAAHGADPARWRWGDAHVARLANRVLSNVPGLSALANINVPTPGDDSTVNRGSTSIRNESAPWTHVHGPGLRAIYDLADLERSRFIIAGGQSGNVMSRHYGDMATRWRDLAYIPLGRQAAAPRRLVIAPAP